MVEYLNERMGEKVMVDGKTVFDGTEFRKEGLEFRGVGKKF